MQLNRFARQLVAAPQILDTSLRPHAISNAIFNTISHAVSSVIKEAHFSKHLTQIPRAPNYVTTFSVSQHLFKYIS